MVSTTSLKAGLYILGTFLYISIQLPQAATLSTGAAATGATTPTVETTSLGIGTGTSETITGTSETTITSTGETTTPNTGTATSETITSTGETVTPNTGTGTSETITSTDETITATVETTTAAPETDEDLVIVAVVLTCGLYLIIVILMLTVLECKRIRDAKDDNVFETEDDEWGHMSMNKPVAVTRGLSTATSEIQRHEAMNALEDLDQTLDEEEKRSRASLSDSEESDKKSYVTGSQASRYSRDSRGQLRGNVNEAYVGPQSAVYQKQPSRISRDEGPAAPSGLSADDYDPHMAKLMRSEAYRQFVAKVEHVDPKMDYSIKRPTYAMGPYRPPQQDRKYSSGNRNNHEMEMII